MNVAHGSNTRTQGRVTFLALATALYKEEQSGVFKVSVYTVTKSQALRITSFVFNADVPQFRQQLRAEGIAV